MDRIDRIEDGADVVFPLPGARWLDAVRIVTSGPAGTGARRTGAVESLLVGLDGTHDLFAGGGSWLRRGIRATPTAGRPVALFLPPDTPWKAENGDGRLLLVGSRQPERPPAPTQEEELGRKPLLPMAGSGKAFDPVTKTWKPKEAFLESPEALLPRRFERIETASGAVVERIAATDYKALSLRVDEVAIPDGATVELPAPGAPGPEEWLLYVEPSGSLTAGEAETSSPVVWLGTGTPPPLTARGGAAYVLVAYAGPKPIT